MMNVISFFSGCGGSSLGYKLAGCNVVMACDWDQNAVNIYAKTDANNHNPCKSVRASFRE